jgi:hypothetical protein
MIGSHRERHELLERHAVLGIDLVQLIRNRGQSKSLLHDTQSHKVPGSDFLLAHATLLEPLECAELIEGVQADPLVVLCERVILGNAPVANDARNSLRLRHALLLHKQFEGAIAPAARRHFEHAGLVPLGINDGPNVEALQERTGRDALGELLDRNARLHVTDVGLA